MLVGIMSDTHDNQELTLKAIELFNINKTELVIHAGDYTSPFTLKLFNNLKCKFAGIFGNNDGDKLLLQERANGNLHNQPYIFTLYEKKFIVIHEHHIVDALADSGHYDIVIYGHTHEAEIRKSKNALIINPGETGAWLYGKATVALLDLKNMYAEILKLN